MFGALAVLVLALAVIIARSAAKDGPTYGLRLALGPIAAYSRADASQVACPVKGRLTTAPELGSAAAGSYTSPADGAPDLLVAPGQVVPFQILIEAAADASDNGTVNFQTSFPLATTRTSGFDGERAILCAFIDTTDDSTDEQNAGTPAAVTWSALPASKDSLRTRFSVSGIDPGEQMVAEVWLVAPAGLRADNTSLEASIDTAVSPGESVDIAGRSARFRLGFFDKNEQPELSLVVSEAAPSGSTLASEVIYTVEATNTAKVVLAPVSRIDAFLDPTTRLLEVTVADKEGFASRCDPNTDGFACTLGFVNAGEKITFTARVAVAANAERRWTKADPGCTGAQYDICLQVVATWKRSPTEDGTVRFEKPTDLPANAKLTISKLAPRASFAYPGSTVPFTYSVINAGVGPLNAVRVTDTGCADVRPSTGDANANGLLDPGENWTFLCSVAQISEATATTDSRVEATDSAGQPQSAAIRTRIDLINPKMSVSVGPFARAANTREIVVSNSGNAPLENIAVTTTNCTNVVRSPGETAARLAPGERLTLLCQAENPTATTTARAYGTDPLEGPVTAATVRPAG